MTAVAASSHPDCAAVPGGTRCAASEASVTVAPFSAAVAIVTRDLQDGAAVAGACYTLSRSVLFLQFSFSACDGDDGSSDGRTLVAVASPTPVVVVGGWTLAAASVPQPAAGGRFTPVPRAVALADGAALEREAWTYRCASTCLWVQPRLGDGTEPGFPLWPLGVPGDFVEPVPHVPQGATAPPSFPTAFVVPNLAPGATTDIPVVADDFGRAPLEVGRIRVNPAPGLNRLEPLTILPAHTVAVNLQNPDGTPADQGGLCLQLRGVSPPRAPRALCAPAGTARLVWRALPGFYVVEQQAGQLPPASLLAPVLPANVPDTQTAREVALDFRFGLGGTVAVAAVNFQFPPLRSLPAVTPPACEIGLFLVTGGTIATSPTATACFPAGTPPGQAVFRVPPGDYVVTQDRAVRDAAAHHGGELRHGRVRRRRDHRPDVLRASSADVPTARPDAAATRPGVAVASPVLVNDSDPSGEALTLEADRCRSPRRGTASIVSGTVVYSAYASPPRRSGPETDRGFTYEVADPWGNTASADCDRGRSSRSLRLSLSVGRHAAAGCAASATCWSGRRPSATRGRVRCRLPPSSSGSPPKPGSTAALSPWAWTAAAWGCQSNPPPLPLAGGGSRGATVRCNRGIALPAGESVSLCGAGHPRGTVPGAWRPWSCRWASRTPPARSRTQHGPGCSAPPWTSLRDVSAPFCHRFARGRSGPPGGRGWESRSPGSSSLGNSGQAALGSPVVTLQLPPGWVERGAGRAAARFLVVPA